MQTFADKLTSYWTENNIIDIKIYHFDEEKIVFNDVKINKKFIIKNDSFKERAGSNFEECSKEVSYRSLHSVGDYLREHSRLGGYIVDNNKLEIYSNIGFYIQNYAEFIIVNRNYQLDIEDLANFYIKDIRIQIDQPSEMFKMVLQFIEEDEAFQRWASYKTIKFYNIRKEDANDYLQQVLFLLEFYKPWFFQLGNKSTYTNLYNRNLLNSIRTSKTDHYRFAKFMEPIKFFNEAIKRYYTNLEDETAFLYFYKVIEYFFLINRKNEIELLIQENVNDIDNLILKIEEIYKTNEKSCLMLILQNDVIKNQIEMLILDAKNSHLISKKDSNELAKEIYAFRNSIAHGKGGNGYSLKTPNLLKQDIKIISWNNLMHNFALICLNQFCYKGTL